MRVEWLPIAVVERENQLAYIAERNPWAAIDMGDAIETAVQQLAHHPQIGRPGRVEGTRELVISRTPYVLAYVVTNEAVRVLRVLHGSQQWPDGFSS